MADLQGAKSLVLDYYRELDRASEAELPLVLAKFTTGDYLWRGMHPFGEQHSGAEVAEAFWKPLRRSFLPLQRRPDVFMAGLNDAQHEPVPHQAIPSTVPAAATLAVDRSDHPTGEPALWVCQMGHLLGLFDRPWLDIPPTRKMAFLRYAEFHRVVGEQIAETALFVDVISIMRQAGMYPLPPQTGASFIHPGPATHDGLLFGEQDPAEGAKTMALVNRMIGDLDMANRLAAEAGDDRMPAEALAETWHDDMIWMGPEGIGAAYTIARYQQQHQYPFRFNLTDKLFNGHVARFAEGAYAGFFGWSNLTNRPTGGFLGLPSSNAADMRVVDVYRRDGDKLAENWVFIDLLHWLSMQGLDVLRRMRQQLGIEDF